jgi:hypothetical protein
LRREARQWPISLLGGETLDAWIVTHRPWSAALLANALPGDHFLHLVVPELK